MLITEAILNEVENLQKQLNEVKAQHLAFQPQLIVPPVPPTAPEYFNNTTVDETGHNWWEQLLQEAGDAGQITQKWSFTKSLTSPNSEEPGPGKKLG